MVEKLHRVSFEKTVGFEKNRSNAIDEKVGDEMI